MSFTIKSCLLVWLKLISLSSCISNPKVEDCEAKEVIMKKVYEAGEKNIAFSDKNERTYYVNRELEKGLTLAEMDASVLNKKGILRLAKNVTGTGRQIMQLATENDVIYTEFK